MKKILVLANNDVGLYKFRKELIEALLKKYEVHIALPYGKFVDDFKKMGCIFHATEFKGQGTNPVSDLLLLKRYKSLIKTIAPAVVLTYTIKPNVYGGLVCAALNTPYIVNITGLGIALENKGILQKISIFLYKFALRKAKIVFFQNNENLQFMLRNKIVKENYHILPGSGVNLEQYKPMSFPEDSIVNFLFVARIMKEKGIDQYIETAEYIRRKYPYTRFHVCGECGKEYEDVLREKADTEQIVYHGALSNMIPMYEMCSCVVHPTYYPEGMSNVLLESCASGRPIITTNRSGCREIVDDGVNGFICLPQNSSDLIDKIEKFLSLPIAEKKKMGENARNKVEKEFDRKIVIDKYIMEIENYG